MEDDAFFYLGELEEIIREWVAVVYHRTGSPESVRIATGMGRGDRCLARGQHRLPGVGEDRNG